MGRDRCLICGRFIFDGEDVTRPPLLGVSVHRPCYLREEGLDEPRDSEPPAAAAAG